MSTEEAKATTKNAEPMDVEHSPSNAALKMAYERTSLRASCLDELKNAGGKLLTKMTDLEIDTSDSAVNSQNIQEALAMLENCSKLNTFKLKLPKLQLQSAIKFKL